jgi:hypothetical protein
MIKKAEIYSDEINPRLDDNSQDNGIFLRSNATFLLSNPFQALST